MCTKYRVNKGTNKLLRNNSRCIIIPACFFHTFVIQSPFTRYFKSINQTMETPNNNIPNIYTTFSNIESQCRDIPTIKSFRPEFKPSKVSTAMDILVYRWIILKTTMTLIKLIVRISMPLIYRPNKEIFKNPLFNVHKIIKTWRGQTS